MHILVATGGAEHSQKAVTFAGLLARDTNAALTLLTVRKPGIPEASARALLEEARRTLPHDIANVQMRIREGHPAEEIVFECEEGGYEMVVVGERQHHTLRTRFLLGSTAHRVVEHAPCPVVVAKGRIASVRRMLLCEGGRADAPLAQRFMQQLPELTTLPLEITVLHVISQLSLAPQDPAVEASETVQMARHILANDIRLLEQRCASVHERLRYGLVVEEIITEAQWDYDMLVVGAHPGSGWRRILLDDITHDVLVKAPAPVLVVR
nr:universal stress protein [Ardenticatena sp.]